MLQLMLPRNSYFCPITFNCWFYLATFISTLNIMTTHSCCCPFSCRIHFVFIKQYRHFRNYIINLKFSICISYHFFPFWPPYIWIWKQFFSVFSILSRINKFSTHCCKFITILFKCWTKNQVVFHIFSINRKITCMKSAIIKFFRDFHLIINFNCNTISVWNSNNICRIFIW